MWCGVALCSLLYTIAESGETTLHCPDMEESRPSGDRQPTERRTIPELVEELKAQNAYLRARLEEADTRDRENRRLLAAALERMPELESQENDQQRGERGVGKGVKEAGGVDSRDDQKSNAQPRQERRWWRRIFGS